jgi:beta-galactosidase
LALKGDPFGAGEHNKVSVWAEMLIPETAQPLATYDHPFFGKFPAITRNQHGKGTLTDEGTVLSDQLQQKIVLQLLEVAGLTGPDQKLPAPVRVKHGTANAGRRMHYYLNYSAQPQAFVYPYNGAREILTGREVAASANVTLAPWDLAIMEELQ